jgi:hypothetical protein
MDSFRSISVVGVAQMVVLGAIAPALAAPGEDDDHRRHHARGHAQTVSHSRADYPVIFHWLDAPGPWDLTADGAT